MERCGSSTNRDGRTDVRYQAAVTLGQIDAASADVVGASTRVAGDRGEPPPRSYRMAARLDLGRAAAAALSVLERVLRDEGEGEDLRHLPGRP